MIEYLTADSDLVLKNWHIIAVMVLLFMSLIDQLRNW